MQLEGDPTHPGGGQETTFVAILSVSLSRFPTSSGEQIPDSH